MIPLANVKHRFTLECDYSKLPMADKILIVDDEKVICSLIEAIAKKSGRESHSAHTLAEAKLALSEDNWDVVFLDVRLPDGDGIKIIQNIVNKEYIPEVVIMTGAGNAVGAELALKSGAWEYLVKPFTFTEIELLMTRVFQYRKDKLASQKPFVFSRDRIIGDSIPMRNTLKGMSHAAVSDANLLITGETGTGKELCASVVHENSSRSGAPFVVLDCSALPANLAESVIFGHKKGAFTGADSNRTGLVKMADGGTLFIDEVGELTPATQKLFLRFIQERTFLPLGSDSPVSSNIRIIAATNKNLTDMVKKHKFREDLFFRLNVMNIEMPPLRDRREDIRPLLRGFLDRESEKLKITKGYSTDFIDTLMDYDWPGNVRELFNALERAVTISGSIPTIYSVHLPVNIRMSDKHKLLSNETQEEPHYDLSLYPSDYREFRLESEKKYLTELLQSAQGNKEKARQISGLSRTRLFELLKKHDLSE